MIDDLVVWLRAVHERAERTARTAERFHPSPWRLDPEVQTTMEAGRWVVDTQEEGVLVANGDSAADLLVMHDPAAALARVEAERLLLASHGSAEWDDLDEDTWEPVTKLYCRQCAVGQSCHCCLDREDKVWPCPAWQTIAWGWRHMPGYRKEWAPCPT